MTWRCSSEPNNRVLTGDERELFIHGLYCLSQDIFNGESKIVEALEAVEENDINWGGYLHKEETAPSFSNLNAAQQVIACATVAKYLLEETEGVPDHSAWAEATIYAIFYALKSSIEVEIDMIDDDDDIEDHDYWHRRRVCELISQLRQNAWDCGEDPDEIYPENHECDDFGKWDCLLEIAMDHILWDRDFLMEDLGDIDEEQKEFAFYALGIGEDYYSDAAPNDTDNAILSAVKYIKKLTKQEDQHYRRLCPN